MSLASRDQAEVVYELAVAGVHGELAIPNARDAAALKLALRTRLAAIADRAKELAYSRTGNESRGDELANLLVAWWVRGKS